MSPRSPAPRRQIWLWLAVAAAAGLGMTLLYPDSYQQDGGHHYLFARFAWKHPEMFVGVWSRPLFTFLYSFPALLGYPAAKLFTVVICLLTAYQTYRLAEEFKIERAVLVAPLLFLQPSYLLLSADTMTEPLFALLLAVALRLHWTGRVTAGMIVASLMILARPEGFFLGLLWGIWVLSDRRVRGVWWKRLASTALLAIGAFIWWLAAWLITGDPLFIKHNWPPQWDAAGAVYGTGAIWDYVKVFPEIAGPLFSVVFLLGLIVMLVRRRMGIVTSIFLAFFLLHSTFRALGLFGSAGYPRYFVCVAPAIALLTLAGWNELGGWWARVPRLIGTTAASAIWLLSAFAAISYTDVAVYARDARAVAEMAAWFRANEQPVTRLIWSQAYMCILLDHDPWEKPSFSSGKEGNLNILRQSPLGTLVFWDGETGPSWYGIRADDLERAGYLRLRSQSYTLDGWLGLRTRWWFRDSPRPQEMHLFYRTP